ncbi:long-chain-fatty-acid--CoA ligase [Altererythrobacter ishigakiensis]|uniref:3-methylmercaptopropionyl-CoA ligase n=1 Tax=Altererythrobacter ishigakiensis TaxID=476157 RepID=A0A562UVD9_9SPHN|nr:long-chain-fatty-acid--CoA ligase [Altererythrobacter ishigakiensis]TWJ09586.1 fatty-acyl-CoA synthase [Altererythrobacter ishigakiensis]
MNAHHDFTHFDDILQFWAKERPDDVAIEQDGRTTTYAELEENTRRIIALWATHGVGKGDRVAWLGKNSDLHCQLYMAAARVGVVMVPIGWRLAPPEIAYILKDTGAKIVFTGEEFTETASQIAPDLPAKPIVIGEHQARKAISETQPGQHERVDKHEAILQLYTSGTTGNPKGVMLSNANLMDLRNPGNAAGLAWNFFEPRECMLVAMPCSHIGGTGLINIAIVNGIRCLVQAEFTPVGVLEAIENGATHMFIVPAALQMVVQHPQAKETDFSALRYLMYGAAPMPLELLKEAVRTMPNAGFLQAYGMTETAGTISILPPEDHVLEGNERMRSAGKAVPGAKIEVRGPDNKEVPLGEIGEVCVKSPSNTAGYWQLPDATRDTIDEDGWLHTGDAAIMDEDGYIYIQDRIKDMIISGGENVYPAEVENAIFGHPAVAEVAVIGVPSERWGEEVKACVVCKPGQSVEEGDIIAYARERVAAFKAPKSVDVIPEMPRNPSGKILRRQLREPYWAGQERQVS